MSPRHDGRPDVLTAADSFYTLAHDLIQSIKSALQSAGVEQFGRVGVVNGAISWDEPECGLLVISPVRIFVAETFPEPVNVAQVCDAPYVVVEYAIQAIRCAPAQEASGNPPSVESLEHSGHVVITDATLVLRETTRYLCGLRDADAISDYMTAPSAFVGPQGGAVGSELHVHVALMRGIA